MINTNNKSRRCEKQQLAKCVDDVCRTYSPIQRAYAENLEQDETVKEFRCNVELPDFEFTDGKYTTDFFIVRTDGEIAIRECVRRDYITKPLQIKLLDASQRYWIRRGVKDWGIVVNAE